MAERSDAQSSGVSMEVELSRTVEVEVSDGAKDDGVTVHPSSDDNTAALQSCMMESSGPSEERLCPTPETTEGLVEQSRNPVETRSPDVMESRNSCETRSLDVMEAECDNTVSAASVPDTRPTESDESSFSPSYTPESPDSGGGDLVSGDIPLTEFYTVASSFDGKKCVGQYPGGGDDGSSTSKREAGVSQSDPAADPNVGAGNNADDDDGGYVEDGRLKAGMKRSGVVVFPPQKRKNDGPVHLIIGDSNVTRLGSFLRDVPELLVDGVSGAKFATISRRASFFQPHRRFAKIFLILGVNDICDEERTVEELDIEDGLRGFADAIAHLYPTGSKKGFVYILMPPIIEGGVLGQRAKMIHNIILNTMSDLNQGPLGDQWGWCFHILADVYDQRTLTMEMLPMPRHFTPYGLELVLDAIVAFANDVRFGLTEPKLRKSDIWVVNEETAISRKYLRCSMQVNTFRRTTDLAKYFQSWPINPECFINGVTFRRIYELTNTSSPNSKHDQSLLVLVGKVLGGLLQPFKEARDRRQIVGRSLDAFIGFHLDVMKLACNNSNFCYLCFQNIERYNNCWATHINNDFHRQNHVLLLHFRFGEDVQKGTIFDRLAYGASYNITSSSIMAVRPLERPEAIFADLQLTGKSQIQVHSAGMREYSVDTGHVSNLPVLYVTVYDQLPSISTTLRIQVNVALMAISGVSSVEAMYCQSSVCWNRSQGGNCSTVHDTKAHQPREWPSVSIRPFASQVECYAPDAPFVLDVKLDKPAGGFITDLIEVYVGVGLDDPNPGGRRCVMPQMFHCSMNFLLATRILYPAVTIAATNVLNEIKGSKKPTNRVYTYTEKHHNLNIHSGAQKEDAGDLNVEKVSFSLFRECREVHQTLLRGVTTGFTRFVEKMRKSGQQNVDYPFGIWRSPDAIAPEIMGTLFGYVGSDTLSLLAEPTFKPVVYAEFWSFFANLFLIQLLEYDSQDLIPWLALLHFDTGIDNDGYMTMKVGVNIHGAKFTEKTKPSTLLIKVDTGGQVHMYYIAVIDIVFREGGNEGIIKFEPNADFTNEALVKILKNHVGTASFYFCRDVKVPQQMLASFRGMISSDKEMAVDMGRLVVHRLDENGREIKESNVYREDEGRNWPVSRYNNALSGQNQGYHHRVEDFEVGRFARDRLTSGFDSLLPGITGNFSAEDRMHLVDRNLTALFPGKVGRTLECERVFAEHGHSFHGWIKATQDSLPEKPSVDAQGTICGAKSAIEDCTCSIQAVDMANVVFSRVISGNRITVVQGPVGCGKTYMMCEVMKFCLRYFDSMQAKPDFSKAVKERVLTPKIFFLSTTNSNVNTIKKTLTTKHNIKPDAILHLAAKKSGPEKCDEFGIKVKHVPSIPEESLGEHKHLLRYYVDTHRIIVSTVDLFVLYSSRLRLLKNTILFLDEASQVPILAGVFLMACCDTMVIFGDTFQTEPYLDLKNDLMKAYYVNVSFMDFCLKLLTSQGEEVKKKCVVRTFFNWRSTPEQCRIISSSCYSEEHALKAVMGEQRLEAASVARASLRVLDELFGKSRYGVSVIDCKGSLYKTPSKTFFNLEEANAILVILHRINEDLPRLDSKFRPYFKVGVLALYDGMKELLIEMAMQHFGEVPSWLEITTVRVAQGQTYTYVIMPLIESAYGDDIVCPETRRAFTADRKLLTVAISRQTQGLILVCNPVRYILDVASPVSKILAAIPDRGLFYCPGNLLTSTPVGCLNWFYNLSILGRDQVEPVGRIFKEVHDAILGSCTSLLM